MCVRVCVCVCPCVCLCPCVCTVFKTTGLPRNPDCMRKRRGKIHKKRSFANIGWRTDIARSVKNKCNVPSHCLQSQHRVGSSSVMNSPRLSPAGHSIESPSPGWRKAMLFPSRTFPYQWETVISMCCLPDHWPVWGH